MDIYLIDGNSYFHRAFHAIKSLTNSKGVPTNAVYGFTTMILKILREKKPDAFAIVFDSPVPTHRHRIYEDYKAQRPETPGDLVIQIPIIKDVIKAFNIAVFELPGYEADDVICTIARKVARPGGQGVRAFIVSGDKDMMQAVTASIMIYDPMKDVVIDEESVRGRFGMSPDKVSEVMALTGDAVDNVPGVKGIGEKTARELLLKAGGLDSLLAHPEKIENERIRKLIVGNTDIIKLGKSLVTIDTDVPVEANLRDLEIREPDWPALLRLFTDLEFRSLIKLIPSRGHAPRGDYALISGCDQLRQFLGLPESRIKTAAVHGKPEAYSGTQYGLRPEKPCAEFQFGLFENNHENMPPETDGVLCDKNLPEHDTGVLSELSFDIEATGRDPLRDKIVGIALCRRKGRAYYAPVRHDESSLHNLSNVDEALSVMKPVLEDASVAKVGHNLKYDMLILRPEGIRVSGVLYDTMVASYLLNPAKPDHSLEDVGGEYLGHRKRSFVEVLGKRGSFAGVPLGEAVRYAAEDAELAMELKEILFERLKSRGLERLYFEIEMPLIYVLSDMEETGVKIDTARAGDLSAELDRDLDVLQQGIFNMAGCAFNINSPRQLAKVLFEDLGLKPMKKTKTGYSTGMEVLEELAGAHELPGKVLNYRTLYKLKTTYTDALPKMVNPATGRIHTSFNQTVTATGRLSSSEPNLQNIPIRGEWGTRIREIFVSGEGHVLVSADYSQVELRILAHMSQDEGLINAFKKNIDVHAVTASDIFGVPPDEVTAEMRRSAKVVNFGIVYGMSSYGLSDALSISPREAAEYIESYFDRHPGVKRYMEISVQGARREGYVSTLLGRIRPLPEMNSANATVRQQAERLAINTPIQGTAADLIKIAMIRVSDSLRARKLSARMLLQIHDELVLEVPENELDATRKLIVGEMEAALDLVVPLKVEIGWGKNWAESHH